MNKGKTVVQKFIAQQKEYAKLLKELQPVINAGDRAAAMKRFKVSYVTMSRYISGKVANIYFAMGLNDFLRKRLAKRQWEMRQHIEAWEAQAPLKKVSAKKLRTAAAAQKNAAKKLADSKNETP
jgi:hypothetical protein